jgi:hypothetical protein
MHERLRALHGLFPVSRRFRILCREIPDNKALGDVLNLGSRFDYPGLVQTSLGLPCTGSGSIASMLGIVNPAAMVQHFISCIPFKDRYEDQEPFYYT